METIFRWRKKRGTGSHSFRYAGERHRVLPGKTVDCPKRCVDPFIDDYDCLGKLDSNGALVAVKAKELEDAPVQIPGNVDSKLQVLQRNGGWYDVVNPDNPEKPVNSKPLRKKDAYELAGLPVPEPKKRKAGEKPAKRKRSKK